MVYYCLLLLTYICQMLKNYLKITVRYLRHNKLYSSINVFGLAVGISCVLLAMLYWNDEHSFDHFHRNGKNIYRITTTMSENRDGSMTLSGGTGQVQGPAFKTVVPEVADYTRLMGGGLTGDVLANNKGLHLTFLFADENFYNIFSFRLLRGNPATALKDLNAVIVTEATAIKFFNSVDVVGKPLQLAADPSAKRLGKPLIITGVAENLPANSSIQFDLLLPFKFMQLSFDDNNWLNAYLTTFVVLHPHSDTKKVIQKFDQAYSLFGKEQIAENIKTYGYNPSISYGLQSLTDIHLNPLGMDAETGVVNGSSPVFSYLFMGIAAFILLMASINFINISIGSSLKRAKEVGVRKIAGGSRATIFWQFLCESALLCLAACILAVFLTGNSLPVFNGLSGKQISFSRAFNLRVILTFTLVLGLIVLSTGFYPAWILSRFSPKEVLYNKQKLSGRNLFGKSLVVLQFSLAVFLLIATILYYNQMNFIRTKDLGYNPNEVIVTNISGDREAGPVYKFLRSSLAKEPSVAAISFGGGESVYSVKLKDRSIASIHKVIDENYLSVMGITLKAGRNISPSFPEDSSRSVLVNEAFVTAAGLDNPVGTSVTTDSYFDKEPKVIVGVIKDFHTASLREPIKPMVMFMNSWYGGGIYVKLQKAHLKEGMAALETAYKKSMPEAVYQYHFLDELNTRQYEQEQRWQIIISIAAILSITICCLGLFGLAHLATSQRIKEIGIRKVLGASVTQVTILLSISFLKLVMIAFFIAGPVAWLVMNNWLQDFAYRIKIGAGVFIASGFISACIAFASVSYQAIKAAVANPVKSLKEN